MHSSALTKQHLWILSACLLFSGILISCENFEVSGDTQTQSGFGENTFPSNQASCSQVFLLPREQKKEHPINLSLVLR